MNYFDKISQREITIFTNEETIKIDFSRSELIVNQSVEKQSYDHNEMYLEMLASLRRKNYDFISTFNDGLKVLKIIAQAENT